MNIAIQSKLLFEVLCSRIVYIKQANSTESIQRVILEGSAMYRVIEKHTIENVICNS